MILSNFGKGLRLRGRASVWYAEGLRANLQHLKLKGSGNMKALSLRHYQVLVASLSIDNVDFEGSTV